MNPIILYFIVLTGLNAGMAYCAYIAKTFRTELGKKIFHIELIAVVLIMVACLYMLSQDRMVCYFARAVYFFLCDAIVIALLHYAEAYTELFREKRIVTYFLYGFTLADGVSMFINVWTHHAFALEPMDSFHVRIFYAIHEPSVFFRIHFFFFYTIMLIAMILLTVKYVKVPGFYKKKYGMILAAFIVAAIVNIVCWPMRLTIDYSLWTYCIMGTAVCYFSLIFLPKGLMERTLASVIMDLNDGIACFDLNGNCIFLNEKAKKICKVTSVEEEAVKDLYAYSLSCFEKQSENLVEWNKSVEQGGKTNIYRFCFQYFSDENGEKLGSFVSIVDQTDEINDYEREHFRATHDALTGILNREYFFQRVGELLREKAEEDFVLVCTDIKDFKFVNDLFGLEKGNEILLKEVKVLQEDKDDFLFGRLMGDQFAFLLPDRVFDENQLIERLSKMCSLFQDMDFHLHINAGVYRIKDREEPVNIMCDKAALAIESVDGDYSKIVAYYDDVLMQKTMEDKKMVNDFDKAIENQEFCFYVQPQCDADDIVRGGEALVRWKHPEYGLLTPYRFIDVYEKTGLIYRLDEFIWESAAQKLQQWKMDGREDFYISVNISPLDFYYMDIYKIFTSIVEKYEINPKNYRLEITETAIMSEVKKNLKIINRLKKYGFLIELDDFGSGYSSLNTLKDIPADILKIDMGFLGITENTERGRIILESIIELAHKIGMSVVCEGVEEKVQVELLKKLGCETLQGYYFAKPMPVEEFEKTYMHQKEIEKN